MEQNNNKQTTNQVFSNNSSEDYEEISEKRTSKLGYILLILMAIFIISIGQTVFSDLKKIPEKPTHPSYCISAFKNTNYLKNITSLSNCRFSETDLKFELDGQYNNLLSQLNQIIFSNKQISDYRSSINVKEREIKKLSRDYDLSLQEKIANEQAIMDKANIKSSITFKKNEVSGLKQKKLSLENQRDMLVTQSMPQINTLMKSYDQALEYHKDKIAFYKFKVFLLMLLFVLPFFALSIHFYFKHKKKNSPYTIIFTAILGASSVLFLQTVLKFLYEILPKEWLTRIFDFFMEVPFLRYIIYYGSVILVIGLFGGLVYFIQKKVFSPAKVAIRRLKDNKCPGCSFTLNPEHSFCPKCGQKIKEKCPSCNNLKIRYLSHCPYCGNKQNSPK